jgi:hypothetical protein
MTDGRWLEDFLTVTWSAKHAQVIYLMGMTEIGEEMAHRDGNSRRWAIGMKSKSKEDWMGGRLSQAYETDTYRDADPVVFFCSGGGGVCGSF